MTWLSIISPPTPPAWSGPSEIYLLLDGKSGKKPAAKPIPRWVPWTRLTSAVLAALWDHSHTWELVQ